MRNISCSIRPRGRSMMTFPYFSISPGGVSTNMSSKDAVGDEGILRSSLNCNVPVVYEEAADYRSSFLSSEAANEPSFVMCRFEISRGKR